MTDSDQLERVARAIHEESDAAFRDSPSGVDRVTLYGRFARAAISAMSPPPEQKPSEEAMRRARKYLEYTGCIFTHADQINLAREFDRVAADERKACAAAVDDAGGHVPHSIDSARPKQVDAFWQGVDQFRETAGEVILARTGCPKGDA